MELIRGKRIVEVADKWLPNAGTAAAPVYPLYYGDLSQAVTLFDRENASLLTTNIGAGAFEKDQTKIRASRIVLMLKLLIQRPLLPVRSVRLLIKRLTLRRALLQRLMGSN
ncbi:phage major capsid protein [Lactiplantibacillus plantarum]|uniref:phage major capsid protein n=1 Tax=Lactiplantibacillus plantarum TaxID=1590 RepID=UPI00257310E2|nr:phage major capsid protein [Lactiplantibacillus plantarum]BEI54992.1 hypothetical protein AWA2045_31230 [Lactiplantibacillus plantarum]